MIALGAADLVAHSVYVRGLRDELPADTFEPARSRIVLVPVHVALVVAATLAVARHWIPWFVVPVASLVIGACFACLAFVAHEGIHGGIVRGRAARHVLGWIGFLPFTISPRLWASWHDRMHHAHANCDGDPDAYPTLAEYRTSRTVRFVTDAFALGGRRWRGALSLLFGFTGQSVHQLLAARRRGFLARRGFVIAIAETLAGVAVWASVAALVGFVPFVFVFVVPLLVANAIVMSFILTNHSLSPRAAFNDPLATSLSVTAPRWIEWLTLSFGYHVEHHLFPAMSSRHARVVRELLRRRWPGRYQSMPLLDALRALHRSARVYQDARTLIDPRTGVAFQTLLPCDHPGM